MQIFGSKTIRRHLNTQAHFSLIHGLDEDVLLTGISESANLTLWGYAKKEVYGTQTTSILE